MMYRPKSNFVFGDVNLADYGEAFAFYCNIFDKPDRDIEVISVPGRNGDLLFDNGRYKNIQRVYIVQVMGIDVAHSLMYKLLNTVGYHKLTDDYDNAYYYMARLKSAPKIIEFVGDAVKMEIVFDRMPQRWLLTEAELVEEDTSSDRSASVDFTINNRTMSVAHPIVRVDFTGNSTSNDVYLLVNCGGGTDGDIELEGLRAQNGDSVIIDSERKSIYNPNTLENMASKLRDVSWQKWLTIPAQVENYVVGVSATKTGNASFGIKAILDTRMWEL